MKQHLLLFLLILISSFEALPQSKIIGKQEFLFSSGEWYKKDPSGKSYKIDKEVITIKFRTSDVENFIGKHGLSIVRKSLNGYYDIRVSNNSPIQEVVEQIQRESYSGLKIICKLVAGLSFHTVNFFQDESTR